MHETETLLICKYLVKQCNFNKWINDRVRYNLRNGMLFFIQNEQESENTYLEG